MGFLYFSNGSLSTCLNLWFFGILGALGKWVFFVFLVALSACIVFFFHSYMSKGMVFCCIGCFWEMGFLCFGVFQMQMFRVFVDAWL